MKKVRKDTEEARNTVKRTLGKKDRNKMKRIAKQHIVKHNQNKNINRTKRKQ